MPDWNDIEARRQAREERERNAVPTLFNAIAYQPTLKQEHQALSWIRHFAYETRVRDDKEQEQDLREKLERLGVQVHIAHYTGDSSFPTEYTLTHGTISAVGLTLDLALMEFVEQLLPKPSAEPEAVAAYHRAKPAIAAYEREHPFLEGIVKDFARQYVLSTYAVEQDVVEVLQYAQDSEHPEHFEVQVQVLATGEAVWLEIEQRNEQQLEVVNVYGDYQLVERNEADHE